MKTREIQLPKGYLSYSQVVLWQNDPAKYAQIYFDGRDELRHNSKAMEYGKAVASALENEQQTDDLLTDTAMDLLKKYDVRDKEIETVLNTKDGRIKIIGRPDTMDSKTYEFREYKTGRVKWTPKKAQNHLQMRFYAMIIFLKYNKVLKDAWLDWIETDYQPDGSIAPTGRVESFHVKFTMNDILQTMKLVENVAKEIEVAYASHVPDKRLEWNFGPM